MKYRHLCMVMAAALAVASACGDDDDDGQQNDEDGGAGSGAQGGGTADGEPDAGDSDGGVSFLDENCPNGVLEEDEGEQCDDGDLNDRDGCTRLCEFTCTEDKDCDDLQICNGTEVCNEEHICRPGKELEDGEWCGPSLSCWAGICVANGCGNGRQEGDEQCDDGNQDETDTCTTACEWVCENDDDCTGGDACAGASTCTDHTCTGTPLADGTACDDGWCQKGVCVPTDCGDGDPQGNEQCDLGDQNGVKGSGCSIDCKTMKCGNNKIEGDEQCDDGALEDWDGCDSSCRAELVHRMRELQILVESAPEFCVYPGRNRLAEAFPGAIDLPLLGTVDTVNFVNQAINGSLDEGQMHPLTAVLGSSDTSMRTTDKEVELALISGAIEEEPWAAAGARPRLDYPYLVQAGGFEDGKAINSLQAEQTGGGYVVTTEPSDLIVSSPLGGSFEMRQMMVRTIFDLENLSKPEEPPKMASSVELPEYAGVGDPDEDPYHPDGRMCGVQPVAALKAMPLFGGVDAVCCTVDGGTYTGCAAGQTPPDCDSLGDILMNGCNVCANLSDPLNPTAECTPGCQGLLVVEPIEPDVDLDGDGTNDGFTTVMAFESIRIRVRGLTEE